MIEVRIRHEDYGTSVRLCDWPAQHLDGVLAFVRAWDVRFPDGEETDSYSGRICVDEDVAYFEIIGLS